MNKSELYRTPDIPLAAALLTMGVKLKSLDASNPRQVVFQFEKTPYIDTTIQDYTNRDLLLEPIRFYENARHLVHKAKNVSKGADG